MNNKPALNTVIITTTNLERLAAFYQEGLDLGEPVFTQENHRGYQLGSLYFGFDLVDTTNTRCPGAVSCWFTVIDLAKTYKKMLSLGGEIHFPPENKPWGATLAAIIDPDGNIVGLDQRRD